MNDHKQVAFDPKLYKSWKTLAMVILTPDIEAKAGSFGHDQLNKPPNG